MSYAASSPSRSQSYAVNTAGPPSQARQAKVYQIDFTAVASGKRIASSKRRVRWRFGFANPQALALGETGTACRGEEHDVTLVWSITSGKRLVLADGQEVHYSSSRNSIFDFSWTMRGNHVLKIVAHAAPPLSQTPNFRQYDFFVDGQSFFTFPKVFRLGLAPGVPSPVGNNQLMAERGTRYSSSNDAAAFRQSTGSSVGSTNIASLEAPNNPDEEEAYLQEAIRQSLQDDDDGGGGKAKAAKKPPASTDLLDFGSDSFAAAAPTPALPPSTTSANPYAAGNPLALPPSDPFGGATGASSSMTSMPALPPSTSANPYGPPSVAGPWASLSSASLPATAGPGGPMASSNGGNYYGSSSQTFAPPPQSPAVNGYGPPPPTTSALVPSATQLPSSSWGLPPTTSSAQTAPWTAPPPVATSTMAAPQPQQQSYYGTTTTTGPSSYELQTPSFAGASQSQQQAPPFSALSTPQQPQPTTPSTIGFMSPPNSTDFGGGFGSPEPVGQESAPPPSTDPALFSMTTLSGGHDDLSHVDAQQTGTGTTGGTSLADQAYAKLVNMDTFSVSNSKNDAPRSNPFEFTSSTTIGGTQSLADIQAKKSSSGTAKPVMNTPTPAPGSMVVSSTQNGSYGASYGMMQQPMMGQQQPYGMGMPNANQAPSYGQTPFGMPSYPSQQPPPQQYQQQMQPPAYGAPPPQPMPYSYGQGPPMSQQPPGYY